MEKISKKLGNDEKSKSGKKKKFTKGKKGGSEEEKDDIPEKCDVRSMPVLIFDY